MGKTTVLVIDPPSGYLYGFPKPAPQNWGFWEWEDKKKWYIEQGYPKEEIESYGNSFYVSMFHLPKQELKLLQLFLDFEEQRPYRLNLFS